MKWPWLIKAQPPAVPANTQAHAQPVATPVQRWPWLIREPFSGAWQQNREVTQPVLAQNATVFACITLLAQDVAKLRAQLRQRTTNDVWKVASNSAYDPVLRRPNHYQSAMEFRASWMFSLLLAGNAYVLKQRDSRSVVNGLHVLNPESVQPMVTPNGAVYFKLTAGRLSALAVDAWPEAEDDGSYLVDDRAITATRVNCLFNPLVGLSPLWAAALPALNGLAIQNNAQNFWSNAARPSGILTAPGPIADDTAKRLAEYWNSNFTGQNAGRVAVLGDALKFEQMTMSADDAQLIEQLKWSAETICSIFHVPGYKVQAGTLPSYNGGEILNREYLDSCLQFYIEAFETMMDDALNLPSDYGVALDVGQLLRLDQAARSKAHSEGVMGGWLTPNEARGQEDLPPLAGGDELFLQQQMYPIRELARRTAPPA